MTREEMIDEAVRRTFTREYIEALGNYPTLTAGEMAHIRAEFDRIANA